MPRIRKVTPESFGSAIARDSECPSQYGLFVIYRFYCSDNKLLYIGVTCRAEERFTAHRQKSSWWNLIGGISAETHKNYREALSAEREAIKIERPKFNRRSAA